MPQPFSQLSSVFANHSIKHTYSLKNRNQNNNQQQLTNQSRRSSSSSESLSSLSLASTATSVSSHQETMMQIMSTPTRQQIDQVRQVWERVCERRHRKDHPSVSSAHAFGLVFYKVLFEMDPSLKFKLGNVIRQARMLAEIMSYLTRSPSIKGETGSLKDLNAVHRSNSKKKEPIHAHSNPDNHADLPHLCAVHAAMLESQRFPNSDYPASPPTPTSPIYSNQFDDDVCPFRQQEQEEKYQQQLLLQQQQQEEQEKQRHSIQQDLQEQLERKLIVQQQEENKWFAYKLREVGIQHVEEYDLVPENLEVFTPSLIAALKSRLQDEFSPEMEQAWVKVCTFTFYHMKMGMNAHVAYHRRARRLSSGSYCSIEAGETEGVCIIQ